MLRHRFASGAADAMLGRLPAVNQKIARFLADRRPETPCLVVDLDVVSENYRALRRAMPCVRIYYAVKANPAPPILRLLGGLGASFDAASIQEIESCLAAGVPPERISYGSTIKKQRDIARAHARGIGLYAFDSRRELEKLAAAAPGAQVYCRILMEGRGADWPLSDKFGCDAPMAADLLAGAPGLGLDPCGVSFHVGSQQRDPGQWDVAIGRAARIFSTLREAGVELGMVNLGGGFPARYRSRVAPVDRYAGVIDESIARHFGNRRPALIVEPGRGLVGDAGVIQSEVVLISRKSREAGRRWVYLDVGKFGGLPETFEESIQYRIRTPRDGGETGAVVLAGPTCDEVDVLYDRAGYELPLALDVGDRVSILSAGAYTATYASVGFNGFPPLGEYYI